MKKIFTFIFAIALSFNVFAQCPLTTAVDFTATDCHGTEVHLFDILDGGQYVLIDFFFTTCGPCQQATPKIVESYYAFGCNMHDVYYVEISVSDADPACQNWAANYGVEYPTIGTTGGGSTICGQYQIGQYPTVILIAPDRSIVIQDLWPISNAQTIITALENHGIQQHDCEPAPIGEVVFSTDTIYINYGGCIVDPGMFTIFNETTADLFIEDYNADTYSFGCMNTGIYAPEYDIKGVTIAPSESLDVYVFFDGFRGEVLYDTLNLITSYGDYKLTVVINNHEAVGELGANNFTLYPNPTNESLVIGGENLGNIQIFNVMGQMIDEFEARNDKDLNINVSNYENGVYFVKVGNNTQRFVVTH